jgi:hypothetical protein
MILQAYFTPTWEWREAYSVVLILSFTSFKPVVELYAQRSGAEFFFSGWMIAQLWVPNSLYVGFF